MDLGAQLVVPPLQPDSSNMRVPCENVMKRAEAAVPAFAVEQEYGVQEPAPMDLAACATSWPHAHLPDPTRQLYGPNGEY